MPIIFSSYWSMFVGAMIKITVFSLEFLNCIKLYKLIKIDL